MARVVFRIVALCALVALAAAATDINFSGRMSSDEFGVVFDPLGNIQIERHQGMTLDGAIVYKSNNTAGGHEILIATGVPIPSQLTDSDANAPMGRGHLVAGDTVTISGTGSTFEVTYSDANSAPSDVRSAIEYALGIWADEWESTVTIRVLMNWLNLPGDTLGSAGSYFSIAAKSCVLNPFTLVQDVVYNPNVLASMTGYDAVPSTEYHIEMNFDSSANWWTGTTTEVPSVADGFDLVSVALHEICHGLFFSDFTFIDLGAELAGFAHPIYSNGLPSRFDSFLVDATDQTSLIQKCGDPEGFFDSITSDNLYFHNQDPTADPTNFKMYSPTVYDGGSSVSHFDTVSYSADCTANSIAPADCSDLMTPSIAPGYAVRSIGDNTRRVLAALKSSYPAFAGKCVTDPWNFPPAP